MNPKTIRIGVVPIGDVPEIASKSIVGHILGYLNLDADVLAPLDHPTYAFDKNRLQYNAVTILKSLESESSLDCAKIIGILNVDLFVPMFTHVFGEARQGGKCALVSLYRLRDELDDSDSREPLLLERAAKVALHESAHLFNLSHCMDERCLMHFSGGLQDLDKAPISFCRYCSVYLRDALSRFRDKT